MVQKIHARGLIWVPLSGLWVLNLKKWDCVKCSVHTLTGPWLAAVTYLEPWAWPNGKAGCTRSTRYKKTDKRDQIGRLNIRNILDRILTSILVCYIFGTYHVEQECWYKIQAYWWNFVKFIYSEKTTKIWPNRP
jgi:hypothetical protein